YGALRPTPPPAPRRHAARRRMSTKLGDRHSNRLPARNPTRRSAAGYGAGMTDASDPPRHKLTREFLLDAGFAAMIRAAMPEALILTDAERTASLRAILNTRPEHGDGLWLFA